MGDFLRFSQLDVEKEWGEVGKPVRKWGKQCWGFFVPLGLILPYYMGFFNDSTGKMNIYL